jgi:hypothetical protein
MPRLNGELRCALVPTPSMSLVCPLVPATSLRDEMYAPTMLLVGLALGWKVGITVGIP